ncbi:MAG: universal stress protein [Haloferacaceae archaeon]
MYDEILVPTDGSAAAERAIDHAVDLAARYDARIHAFYVVDTSAYAALEGAGTTVVDVLEEQGEEAVDEIVAAAEAAGVEVERVVRHGSPHRNILDYIDEANVDLVVMGTHGRQGLDRYLLGSVTERVVRSSPVPVLTVRKDEDEEEV